MLKIFFKFFYPNIFCQLKRKTRVIDDSNIKKNNKTNAEYEFYVSDLAESFQDFASMILPNEVKNTKKINIEEY